MRAANAVFYADTDAYFNMSNYRPNTVTWSMVPSTACLVAGDAERTELK